VPLAREQACGRYEYDNTLMRKRRTMSVSTRTAAILAALMLSVPAAAAYPDKPIRLVVPFAPGGNIDITARTVAPGLSEGLGQPVIVENRGGAGGRIATAMVAKSAPDGYTILLGASGTLAVQPVFHDNPGYDPLRDFTFTSTISLVPIVLVVHPSVPARSVKELIALSRKNPGTLLMGSAGTGSNTHLTGEMFQSIAKVKFTHIPYKGSGAAMIDLMGGQVHMLFDQLSASWPQVKSGKLRMLAVTARERSALLPDIPTAHESGLTGFESSTYTGLALPIATPKDAVGKVREALLKVLDQPTTRQNFERMGAEVIKSTPEEFARRLKEDQTRLMRVRKETGIRVE
jgi:tripartite-type tricarboxylate transporter receptor subunit TctC